MLAILSGCFHRANTAEEKLEHETRPSLELNTESVAAVVKVFIQQKVERRRSSVTSRRSKTPYSGI